MKKIAKGIHRLSQRAAEIRQVVEAMPAKAAELRAAVTATAGQMQQLRADLASGVSALRPGGEAEAMTALREVDGAADVLAEAGFLLGGAELDLGIGRRLRVRLERVEAVEHTKLLALLASNAHRPIVKALLAGIVQASEVAGKVEFTQLDFTDVVVEVGTGQAVRIGWSAESASTPAAILPATAAEPRPPTFSQSTFFARPSVEPTPVPAAVAAPGSSSAAPTPGTPPETNPLAANWRASALDRFKKMPDLTKRPAR